MKRIYKRVKKLSDMRSQKASSRQKHNTLRDCQSRDPTVTDAVIAHKVVRSRSLLTDTLTSNAQATLNNVEIKGQTQFPDDFHEQFSDHFLKTGQALRAPRLAVDSATVQGMLCVKNNTNVENLSADGCIDARGNFHCFGTAHFYGPIKIHDSFEVDQSVLPPTSSSLLSFLTEPPKPSIIDRTLLPPPERVLPKPPTQEAQKVNESAVIPIQRFQCKHLNVDHARVKESLEVKQLQAQRACVYKQESKELQAGAIEANTLVVDDNVKANHVHAHGANIDLLEVEQKLKTNAIQAQHIESFSLDATNIKAKNLDSEKVMAGKIGVKQLDITKQATIEELSVKKSVQAQGPATFTDSVQIQSSLSVHDRFEQRGAFSLKDRIESEVGQPIQVKQTMQLHKPLCFSNYQYFIFNTQQTSSSKAHQVTIHEESTALIIDSDVMNILSLEIKLPLNPVKGQLLTISTNPSITNVTLRALAPILNALSTMAMGSFAQYMYIQEANKWFRSG